MRESTCLPAHGRVGGAEGEVPPLTGESTEPLRLQAAALWPQAGGWEVEGGGGLNEAHQGSLTLGKTRPLGCPLESSGASENGDAQVTPQRAD